LDLAKVDKMPPHLVQELVLSERDGGVTRASVAVTEDLTGPERVEFLISGASSSSIVPPFRLIIDDNYMTSEEFGTTLAEFAGEGTTVQLWDTYEFTVQHSFDSGASLHTITLTPIGATLSRSNAYTLQIGEDTTQGRILGTPSNRVIPTAAAVMGYVKAEGGIRWRVR
jgi:hypothetical protein